MSTKYDRDVSRKGQGDGEKDNSTNLIDFSFLNYKSYFERLVIGSYHKDVIIGSMSDFWGFVNKYEIMLKKKGQPILPDPVKIIENKSYLSSVYQKRMCTFMKIEASTEDLYEKSDARYERSNLTQYKIDQFFEIVLLYLDFKQKERFMRLKQLRKSQISLPIYKEKENILEALNSNQIVIIAGDTGCGKSTQIPQYLYEHGVKNIVCTQPRRLACISLSKRVAHEMLCDYGSKVGYQIRFEKRKTSQTDICFITEGLLLRQLAMDADLSGKDILILDEIHERNLHGDFLLGITKCLLTAKKNLRILLMSATIHIDLFKNYFSDKTVSLIQVPGRLFPIKVHYMPPIQTEFNKNRSSAKNRLTPEPYIQILNLIDQKYPETERGDVLIFMSGVHEIQTIIDAAKEYAEKQKNWIILPLHSGLSLSDQDKVFDYAPEGLRKCIVSTNIAETSITVDGVRFVIDSGKMKVMNYDSTSKMQKLKEFWISKSSAEQRKGRAGRTGPGVCYRLYSEKDYENMADYTVPEIHRVPLDSMLLQMISMGLSNVRLFPFIEAPSQETIEKAMLSLQQHDAITINEKITSLGKALSTLPVDISIGKMLLMGCIFEQLQLVLTLSAILSIQSPFTNRAFKVQKCERARKEFESSHGEPLTLLNIYREWLEMKWYKRQNTRVWCHGIGVEEQRFYELTKLRNQFQNILENSNIIQEMNNKNVTSAERSLRYGEIKTLRAIKRSHDMEAPKARKIIKLDEDDENPNFDEQDIRDVDFRLSNDSSKLKTLLSSANAKSHRDVLILKLIIVSGFYPQIAIPDDLNATKSEQFFHTFSKPFVLLHPNGQFANTPDFLKLSTCDIVEETGSYVSKLPLSSKHQILCYQSLLETTKPYLLNTIRMPAAQTLMLFSFTIDTNIAVTRIICDSWLCLDFPTPEAGQSLLSEAVRLRSAWNKMLSTKLCDIQSVDKIEINTTNAEQMQLFDDLIAFLNKEALYTMKRLLTADLKDLYVRDGAVCDELPFNPFSKDFKITPNEAKGGYNVTDNVTYACVKETQWSLLMEDELKDVLWKCNNCNEDVAMTGISKVLHMNTCIPKPIIKETESNGEKDDSRNSGLRKFVCETCHRELIMNQISILRHRRKCVAP